MAGTDPIWLFLHLPKTAGRTLNNLFYKNDMSAQSSDGYEARLSTERVAYVDPGIYHVLDGFSRPLSLADLRAVGADIDPSIATLVLGHYSFGLHKFLRGSQSTYVTILRDPVARTISHFNHMVRYGDDTIGVASGQTSLIEFARLVANDQSVRLAGPGASRTGYSTLLRLASDNLQTHFSLVGVTDRFDETVFLLAEMLGWERPTYVPQNVDLRKTSRSPVEPETIAAIEELNDVDRELYRLARTLLDARIRDEGPGFAERLARFRDENRRDGDDNPFPVDVNIAGPVELMRLPGIGRRRAQRVISHREAHGPFASFEDFCSVAKLQAGWRVAIQDLVVP